MYLLSGAMQGVSRWYSVMYSMLSRMMRGSAEVRINQRSIEAFYSLHESTISKLERQVLDAIANGMRNENFGMTTWEIEVLLGGKHQTISACVSRLWHQKKTIRPSGVKRPTDTGRMADVYELILEGVTVPDKFVGLECEKCQSPLVPSRTDDGDFDCLLCGNIVYRNVIDISQDLWRKYPSIPGIRSQM